MKIRFGENDGIYKIFKTLEKVGKRKKVEIIIHPRNSFFNNLWLGKQVIDFLNSKGIDYKFICKNLKTREYFKNLGVDCEFDKKLLLYNFFLRLKFFLFSTKDAHKKIIGKKNYMSFFLIFIEIISVIFVGYFLYYIITPHAEIYVKPSFSVEEVVYNFRFYPEDKSEKFQNSRHISIPFHKDKKEISYNMEMNVEDINYLEEPSKGKVKVINTSEKSYSIVANSKFVTEDGLLFRSTDWFKIPAADENGNPGTAEVTLEAMEKDKEGKIIGERGNIDKGKKLYIENMKNSYYTQDVYAVALEDFEGGETEPKGVIKEKDIKKLRSNLRNYVKNNKRSLLQEEVESDEEILLKGDNNVQVDIKSVDIPYEVGEQNPVVEGNVDAEIRYKYLFRDEVKEGFEKYIQQRGSEKFKMVNIDRDSLMFYFDGMRQFENYFVLPSRINVVRGYDFNKDINELKSTIKSKIVGKSLDGAKDIILSYPEIDVAIIKTYPPWYQKIPSLKSRIGIQVNK